MEDDNRTIENQEELSAGNVEAVIQFIDNLSYLDDVDRYWARKDAKEAIAKGEDSNELKEKYQFYDRIAELQQQIVKNIPSSKQEEVLNIIRQVTSKPTGGSDRQMKLEHVLRVKRTVDAFRENQITLQFLVQEKITSGNVHFGVAQILSEDLFKNAEKMFPDRFWKLSDRMSPSDFPHFTVAFNFALKESFTQDQSTSKLKDFSEKIKKSILEDAEHLLSEFFPEKAKGAHLQSLKKISSDKPSKLLGKILAIGLQREKHETEAQKEFKNIHNLVTSKNPKGAKGAVDTLKKKFGVKVFDSLRQKGFITKLETTILQIGVLEKQLKTEKNPALRKKIEAQLSKLQQPEKIIKQDSSASGEGKKKVQDILQEIQQHKQQGDLSSAERSAQKLRSLDSERAAKEIEKIKSAQAKKDSPKEEVKEESVSEGSESKQKKILFLEMLKEHARKVMEECGQLGIPKDSEEFWGLKGVRNRMQYLKDKGLWSNYQRFNSSDRNMPSKTHEGGFRFRWVNVTTGTNLNTTSAQRGIEYLRQRKESGYQISALAGAFSVNWKGHSSPVYTPERFISFVEMELSRVKGSSSS
jgi:hypothetical protein